MSTPLFLLMGLALATCVIAYWSDNLGKKLGKKRVTLFGLRPRQTATLMTMGSSVLIMLFTFGVLLATNSGLRGALLRYDKEKADNKELRFSNEQLRTQQQSLQKDVVTAEQQAAQAKKNTVAAQKQTAQARDNYQGALEQLKQRQEQLQSARGAERIARSNEHQARSGEKTARNRAEKARRDLEKKQNELGRVNGKLTFAQNDLKKLQSNLRIAQGKVSQARGRLSEAQGRLAQTQDELGKARQRYAKDAEESLEEIRRLLAEINERTQEIKDLQAQKETLAGDIKQLELVQIQLARPFQGDVDVPQGAVYAERLIAPRTSVGESSVQLRAMLAEGREEIAKENQKRIVKLLLKDGTELTQEVIIDSLAKFLENSPVPSSVRLSALRNHAKAETEIQCAFLVVPARTAFRRNEVIAGKVIDGSQSDARVFNQLLYDLLDAGEVEANRRSIVPILRGGAKLYADGTNERLFEALRRIRAIGKPVEVRLLADDDLTTIDQLRVRFEIVNPAAEL